MGKRKQWCNAGSSALPLPMEMRKLREALFEQQMWCWGCDVRREAGNLLLTYGMQKHPAPEPRYHSAYSCTLETSGTLMLWGWGLWVAIRDCGTAFISRSNFRVCYSDAVELRPAAWCEAHLPPFDTKSGQGDSACLLATTFRWIANYEGWVACLAEPDYRERTMVAWPHRRRYRGGIPAREISSHWMHLAQMAASIRPS
jgi:hypothetical protein